MQRNMLRAKIQDATITGKSLECEGSITIDAALLKATDMLPNERVQVLNLNNGNRFETYIIKGEAESGDVALNGPAARMGEVGDKIIIAAYGLLDPAEAAKHRAIIVRLDDRNRPLSD